MTPSGATSHGQSSVVAWMYRNLAIRRGLPLAALMLWGCLLMTALAIHPDTPRSQLYQDSLPFNMARGSGIDYYQFWLVGRAQERLHLKNIYSRQDRQRLLDFGQELLRSSTPGSTRLAGSVAAHWRIGTYSTPFLYAAVNAFASAEYERDYDRFLDLSLAASVLALLAMAWVLGFSPGECLLVAAVALFWCDPLAYDLRVGNVNQLQLAGVALYLVSRVWPGSRWADLAGGVVLGLLVAFKPTLGMIPMMLTLAWVMDRRWRTLLRQGVAAVLAAVVAGAIGCGFLKSWSAWFDWASALTDLDRTYSLGSGNYSLAQVIFEATRTPRGGGWHVSLLLLVLVLVLAGVGLMLTRPRVKGAAEDARVWFERDFLVTALGCTFSVVALKLAYPHYYALVLPLLLYVLRPAGWLRPDARGLYGLLWPVVGLVAGLLALAAVFGKPVTLVLEPGFDIRVWFYVSVGLYIGGAWGLTLLGLAAFWFTPRALPEQDDHAKAVAPASADNLLKTPAGA